MRENVCSQAIVDTRIVSPEEEKERVLEQRDGVARCVPRTCEEEEKA